MAWDPEQYERFAAARRRPARDLVAALPALRPGTVVDLGCGGGQLARELAERWPVAAVAGVDSSAAMLASARSKPSRVTWVEADIGAWQPPEPVDLIISNAALHWLDDHARVFPRLLEGLRKGGILAVQMPRNFEAPSHRLIREVAAAGPWAEPLAGLFPPVRVHNGAQYYDWLAPLAFRIEIWETEYLHILPGEQPVLEWIKGSTLVPALERLNGEMKEAFLAACGRGLEQAYPRRADGMTLFPFRRIFIIAERAP